MNKNLQYGIAVLVIAFALNWISVAWFKYPFVYCWGQWPVMHLIAPYYHGVFIVAVVYFAYVLFRQGIGSAMFQGMVVVFLVAVFPDWMRTLWSLGAACK
jgi:hypothetical protein